MIEKLFLGNLDPFGRQYCDDNEYARLLALVSEADQTLRDKLSPDIIPLLDNLRALECQLNLRCSVMEFTEGFSIAVELGLDVAVRMRQSDSPRK